MPIELHCPACGKLIRAPDNAGGRRGKCPYCASEVYIPLPREDGEDDLLLRPLDNASEARREQLRKESIEYAAGVDRERGNVPPARSERGSRGSGARQDTGPDATMDVSDMVRAYVMAMRDSDLDRAERLEKGLARQANAARDYIQGLMVDQMGLRIENMPQPLIQGFLKNLLSRLA